MSEMQKLSRYGAGGNGNYVEGESKGLRMYKSVFRLAVLFPARAALRALRHGQREDEDDNQDESGKDMPKLREAVLSLLQDIGDRSGCHQMPERSFIVRGYVFPVCARCTGVAAGQTAAVASYIFGLRCPYYAAVMLLAVMGIDWLVQRLGIKESTNTRRFMTGICAGFGLFVIYINTVILLCGLIF